MQFLRSEVFVILFCAYILQQHIKIMLLGLQSPFLFNKTNLLPFYGCFFCCNCSFKFYSFIGFFLLLFVKLFVSNIKAFKRSFSKLNRNFLIILFYLKIFLRLFGLVL